MIPLGLKSVKCAVSEWGMQSVECHRVVCRMGGVEGSLECRVCSLGYGGQSTGRPWSAKCAVKKCQATCVECAVWIVGT